MAPLPQPTAASSVATPSSTLQVLAPRAGTATNTYNPGAGVMAPERFNNKGYFALFALLGAAMVVASIWFFFWAKHGGFSWQRTDWDDYKSTVLRRKGKDGKTLSNATPHTDLGEKSVAGSFDYRPGDARTIAETVSVRDFAAGGDARRPGRPHPHHNPDRHGGAAPTAAAGEARRDEDLRRYRRERVAKVGGLNSEEDGSHFDYSNLSRSDLGGSDISSRPLRPNGAKPELSKKQKKEAEREAKAAEKQRKKDAKAAEKGRKEAEKRSRAAGKAAAQPLMSERPRHTFVADEAASLVDSSIHPGSSASQVPPRRPSGGLNSYFSSYRPPAPPYAPSRRHEQRRASAAHGPSAYVPPPARHAGGPVRPAAAATANATPSRRQQQPSYAAPPPRSEAGSSDTGTKVYSHHIPGLSSGARDAGFQRARRDSLSDSDDDDMGSRSAGGFRRR